MSEKSVMEEGWEAIAKSQGPDQDTRATAVTQGYLGEDKGYGDGGQIMNPRTPASPPQLEPDYA